MGRWGGLVVRTARASAQMAARPWRGRRWLVLAPHPDDETLGAGALIAQSCRSRTFAGLVYLTDGSGSHPATWGRPRRLVAVRAREGALALARLTGSRQWTPVHLGWKDAHPFTCGSAGFERGVRKVSVLCRRSLVDAIAVTAAHEPHCDHSAAAELAYAVKARLGGRLVVAEYCIWADAPKRRFHALRTAPMRQGLRRWALSSHRSQLSGAYGRGFRLSRHRMRPTPHDTLYVRRTAWTAP